MCDVDYFPLWKPSWITLIRIKGLDFRDRYKALRNSSSSFISKRDVRNIIFKKCKLECVFCQSRDNLSIDHIVSIYKAARGEFPIEKLNIRDNLQLLCSSCNSRKAP